MSLKLKPLSQQTLVITGASSGIGLATARAAARKGANLVLASRNEKVLAELVREFETAGVKAVYAVTEVSRREDIERLAEVAIERFGGFDTWVNNAGVGLWGKLEEVSDEDHRRLFDVNFWSVVYGSTTALRHLKQNGGALINLGSVASDLAFPVQSMYATTKHAIKGFTDALRRELRAEGAPVSVTLIQPAAIGTPFAEHAKNYSDREAKLPPPVYAPEDVANTILLAAEHAKRDVYVGGAGHLMGFMGRFTPRMVDRSASLMVEAQYKNQPKQSRQDNLWNAGDDGRERGSAMFIRRSGYTAAVVHPVTAAVVLSAAAAGFVAWKKLKS